MDSLEWSQVDPRAWPFDPASPDADLVARVLADGRRALQARVTRALVAAHGPWAAGWSWSRGEGGGGGVVLAWCCESHSARVGVPDDRVAAAAAAALREWRAWLERLAARFDELPFRAGPDDALRHGAAALVADVAEATLAWDAWYLHARQVLEWYLVRYGVPLHEARDAVARATSGRFESWVAPTDARRHEVAHSLVESFGPGGGSLDATAIYVRVRRAFDWTLSLERATETRDELARARAGAPVARPLPLDGFTALQPVAPAVDGHSAYIDVVDAARSEDRAARMHAALRRARALARAGRPLTLDGLSALQAKVETAVGRRSSGAFAKGGEERYAYHPRLHEELDGLLAESGDPALSPLARAARAYLDVCFFHPFVDGNARCARLAFDWVLTGAGLCLPEVAPIFALPTPASDIAPFVRIVYALGRRTPPGAQSRR